MNKLTPLILFGIICTVMLFTVSGNRGMTRLYRVSKKVRHLEAENHRLTSDIYLLKRQIDYAKSDKFFLEKAAREQLALSKPGEIVYIFPRFDKKD